MGINIGNIIQIAGMAIIYRVVGVDFNSSNFWLTTLGLFLTVTGSRVIQEYKSRDWSR